jgi:allophanate hydrolase
VSILALTAGEAQIVATLAQQPQPSRGPHRAGATTARGATGPGFSFAVPRETDLEFYGAEERASLFRKAIARLEQMGGERCTVDFGPFRQVGEMLYGGPWLAERLAGIEDFLGRQPTHVHPVSRAILARGAKYSAVDLFRARERLKALRAICMRTFDRADVLVVPTFPALPTRAEVAADSEAWSQRLGYYTSFVNLLGLAALALPSDFDERGLPAGITLVGPAGSDARLCELGLAWQRRCRLPLGATRWFLAESLEVETVPARDRRDPDAENSHTAPSPAPARVCVPELGSVRLAVAGAHLRGQPFHAALRGTGARFVRGCRTACRYRFVALMDLDPPRPGLLRDDKRGGAVLVEIYDLPMEGFGRLVGSVAPPLAIGTIELEDGEAVKGFLCESHAAVRARDITDFGGWVAFREQMAAAQDTG